MKNTAAEKFVRGAAILTLAGLLSKILGSTYRIVLTRLLGAEGIGLFELAYPIYITLLTLSQSGVPIALAQLVAKAEAKGNREESLSIFRAARFYSLIIGLSFTLLLLLGSRLLVNTLGWDPRVLPSILAIAPAIFLVSIMAAYRGYFQGFQRMGPTGISQVVEQSARIITMFVLVYAFLPKGVMYSAAGATFGAVAGALAGLGAMIYFFKKSGHAPAGLGFPSKEELKKQGMAFLKISIPISFGSLVLPLMSLVDATIIPARLQVAGLTVAESTALYGTLATAMVLVNFPTLITVSLASSLVPSISEAITLRQREVLDNRVQTALRLAIIVGLPASLGMYALAKPLTVLLFSLPEAAIPLRFVCWGVFFTALQQTSAGILQGAGQVKAPVKNLFWGALLNGVINFILVANPKWGIKGAALGTALGFALVAVLNLIALQIKIRPKISLSSFVPIVTSSLGMFLTTGPFFNFLQRIFKIKPGGPVDISYITAVLLAVFAGIVIFIFLLFLTGGIKEADLRIVPRYGERLIKVFKKLRLIRE